MKKLTNMQKLRKYAKWAKAEYGTDIKVSLDGKVSIRRKLISDWHREMWEWIAEHPEQTKLDFLCSRMLGKKHTGHVTLLSLHSECFACLYSGMLGECDYINISHCEYYCPFFENVNCCCDGLYDAYEDAYDREDYEEVSRLAKEIANLEWKWRDGNEIQQ